MTKEKNKQYKIRKIKENLSAWGFLTPYMFLFVLFFIVPFVYGIYISFFDWNMFNASKIKFVGFDNFKNILFNNESIYYKYFWEGIRNTLIFVVISVPLLIVLPLFLAILIENKPKGYKIFRTLLFMPTVFSISAVILIWRWQFYTNGGFINSVLTKIGLSEIEFLTKQPWAWVSILIVTIWWTMGTNMVILSAGIKNVDKSMIEAASIDGATEMQKIMKIVLPSIKPQLFLVGVMTTIASFNIYGQPDLLTNGGPNNTTTVLMMRIRSLASGVGSKPGVASAMALMMGILLILVSVIQFRVTNRKEKD